MKKLSILVLAVLFAVPAFAGNWGAGVRLGVGENDPEGMDNAFHSGAFSGSFDENPGIFAIEGLYEMPLRTGDETNKIGFRLGFDFYGENELDGNMYVAGYGTAREEATETTWAVPLTAYYKYDGGIKRVSFWGGAGFTFLKAKLEEKTEGFSSDYSKTKTFFHIAVGSEYRFSELFALGLDLKYNFAAKAKDQGIVISDRSGLSGALAARFYFQFLDIKN